MPFRRKLLNGLAAADSGLQLSFGHAELGCRDIAMPP